MIVVVDASVAIKWYVDEIFDAEAELLLAGGFELQAPELLIPEFGNIIWKKNRSGQLPKDEAMTIIEAFGKQNIKFHSHKSLLLSSINGSLTTGQTVYDWTYLSLAISLECPFVTADARFYDAVKNTAVGEHLLWIQDVIKQS